MEKGRDIFNTLKISLIVFTGYLCIRFLRASMRIRFIHEDRINELYKYKKQRIIYCFWHDRLLMMPFITAAKGVKILISQHKDGEYISRICSLFGYGSVRGSSTRGGSLALRRMTKYINSGWNGAITPDGPRGPRHIVKEGAVILASLTGAPLIPVSFSSSKKKTFHPGTVYSSQFPSQGVFL